MEFPGISFGDLLRFEYITSPLSILCMSTLTSNSSGNMQKHGYLGCFHAASARENICWVWVIRPPHIKGYSLAPGRSYCDFEDVIFNPSLLIGIFKSSFDNVLRWIPQDLTDDKSTLVQVRLGAVRQQAITWTSVDQDLQGHMASLGPNELSEIWITIQKSFNYRNLKFSPLKFAI